MDKIKLLWTAPVDFDLSVWEEITSEFDVIKKHIPKFEDVTLVMDSEFWVCNPLAGYVINKDILLAFPNLRVLATPSTGTNHINLDDCAKFGVKVISLKDDPVRLEEISASSEFTLKLLIDAFRLPPKPREIYGKDIGIVGFGRIGKRMYKYLQALGARYIVANDPPLFGDVASTPLEVLFKLSDAVIISCAYTPQTHHLITRKLLESMQEGAVLVNTSRGEVINSEDLAYVMADRPDLKVALDVLEGETSNDTSRWVNQFTQLGAIVTPHIAGNTFDSRTKAAAIILGLLRKEIHGKGKI